MKTSYILPVFLLALSFPVLPQTVSNTPSTLEEQTNSNPIGGKRRSGDQLQQKETLPSPPPGTMLYTLTPDDVKALQQQGYDPATLPKQVYVETDEAKAQREKMERLQQQSATPTPPDLKHAIIYMDSFLGTTNSTIVADVISVKAESLKFQFYSQTYDYSGHYTVVLNTPRKHKNPFFGFGSPDKAKFVVIDDFGGQPMPLPNATIWQKSNGFIDVESLGREWIYSGTYTIQN